MADKPPACAESRSDWSGQQLRYRSTGDAVIVAGERSRLIVNREEIVMPAVTEPPIIQLVSSSAEESMLRWTAARCVVALAVVWSIPGLLCGQSPVNPSSSEFVDAFIVTERAKLIDKAQKQGDKFDQFREMEKLQQKHMKVFGTPLPANLHAEFDRTARETPALPPEQLDPGNKRSPTELSPDLFIAHAKVKFMEDIREEGTRFDTSKEFSKLSERFERNFGRPIPQEMQDSILRSADSAREIIATQRADMATRIDAARPKPKMSKTSLSSPPRTRKVVHGVRYPDGLPDWFIASDRNHDGQVGLYEWDRDRFAEFSNWDTNGDGLLEPREVLRLNRQATPPARATAKGPGLK